MTTSRRFLWAAASTASLTGLLAGAHSALAAAEYLGTGVADAVSLTAWVVLSPFTGWVVSIALVTTVTASLSSRRRLSRWWEAGAVGTALLVLWTTAACVDGLRVTDAWRSGADADRLVTWPGEATPQGWWDAGAAPGWDFDLLSASGPVIVLLAVWAGPLVLRADADRAARPVTAATAPPESETALRVEIGRAAAVAAAVGAALCTSLVYLRLAGGVFAAGGPHGEPLASLLVRPAGLLVVLVQVVAWRAARPGSGAGPSSPPDRAVVLALVGAVVAVSAVDGSRPDVVLLVAGVVGLLCAAGRRVVAERAATVLLSPVTRVAAAPPLVPGGGPRRTPRRSTGRPSPETTRPPAVDALP